jgi:4-hydroxy-2-oxoheptanedioate aldolase
MAEPLRQSLREGRRLLGLFSNLPAAAPVEMAGYAGFDFVLIDSEHGALSWGEVEDLVRAAEAAGVAALVRVPAAEPHIILKALDRGCAGLHVPHVDTAEEAAAVVRAAKYPPLGERGAAFTPRWARYGFAGGAQGLERANRETLLAVHVETRRAVDNVREILAVPGIDLVYLGPTDLSVSLGHPSEPNHPEVREAFDEVLRRCREAGMPCGAHSGPSEVAARFAWGAQYVGVSLQPLLAGALRAAVAARPQG